MFSNSIKAVPLFALVVYSCLGKVADHETLGDRAYLAHEFVGALVEYRLAMAQGITTPVLRGKAGAAALRSRDLVAAAREYAALAEEDRERITEAADGLERVAVAAIEDGNREALQVSLESLMEIAEGRALGRFAQQVADGFGSASSSQDALAMLPYAAAVASDTRTQDSLVHEYAQTMALRNECSRAVPIFESLLRRRRNISIIEDAQTGLAECALSLGHRALNSGRPTEAEEWFRKAVAGGGQSHFAMLAYIGLGDVMFAQGDFLGAADAYWEARFGAAPGSGIYRLAEERLNNLGDAGTVEGEKGF